MKIGILIMASGQGKRFGSNKLLTQLEGKPMVTRALSLAAGSSADQVLVVTIHPEIEALSRDLGLASALHFFPHRNQAIAFGMEKLKAKESLDGLLFLPGDQPGLTLTSLEAMLSAFRKQPDRIYRLHYQSTPGSPVLFPQSMFEDLSSLPQKCGGAQLIKRYPDRVTLIEATNKWELFDIDTREDLEAFLNR